MIPVHKALISDYKTGFGIVNKHHTMKTKLTTQQIKSLSVLLNQDEEVLKQLDKYGILDISKSRAYLIKAEYKQISGESGQRKQDIVLQLAQKYRLSVSSIEVIVYSKQINKRLLCNNCGSEITKYKYGKNEGKCDNCKSM